MAMVRIYFIIFCLSCCLHIFAQEVIYVDECEEDIVEVGLTPEDMPVYQLGNQQGELLEFHHTFSDYIEPPVAYCDSVRKWVVIQFDVETSGEISNIKILKGLNAEMDREAVRVIKLLKCIRPAYTRGQPVKHQETIPVTFCREKIKFFISVEGSGQIRLKVFNKTDQQIKISNPKYWGCSIPVITGKSKSVPRITPDYLDETVIIENNGVYETYFVYPIQKIIRGRKRQGIYLYFAYRGKIDGIKTPVTSNIVEFSGAM